MSDALTDISRDQERGRRYDTFLKALKAYLKEPTPDNRGEVVRLAQETDEVVGGYFGGRTRLAEDIEKKLDLLSGGDRAAWAKFLFSLHDTRDFKDLKKLSPFAGKLLVVADYGIGFVTFRGDVENFVDSIIQGDKGWRIYDADKYVVVMDQPDRSKAEVFWVGDGRGRKDPKKAE